MDITKIMLQLAEATESQVVYQYGNDHRFNGGSEDDPIIIMSSEMSDKLYKHRALERAAESAGIDLCHYDEYTIDDDGVKAWRTSPDSYFWQPACIWDDNGNFMTPDDDIEMWIDWALNDPRRCITAAMKPIDEIIEAGFQLWPDDDTRYENGFHQGMDDDPVKLTDAIHASFSDISDDAIDIIFYLAESSQFYVTFKALVRVNWQSVAISSNQFSHDQQVDDVLNWMRGEVPEHVYNKLLATFPEIDRRVLDGAHFDCEAMRCDVEWSSWIADAIEETGYVFWEEGEPWARVLPDGKPVTL